MSGLADAINEAIMTANSLKREAMADDERWDDWCDAVSHLVDALALVQNLTR